MINFRLKFFYVKFYSLSIDSTTLQDSCQLSMEKLYYYMWLLTKIIITGFQFLENKEFVNSRWYLATSIGINIFICWVVLVRLDKVGFECHFEIYEGMLL